MGPPPALAFFTASRAARYTASASFPSTRTPSKPYATAFCAIVSEAVCLATGREIAHWLLLHTNTVGVRKTPAKFIPAWKSPVEVPPSPKYARETMRSPRSFAAHAAPTARGIWVPTQLEIDM